MFWKIVGMRRETNVFRELLVASCQPPLFPCSISFGSGVREHGRCSILKCRDGTAGPFLVCLFHHLLVLSNQYPISRALSAPIPTAGVQEVI
jgi:hypothetical protein